MSMSKDGIRAFGINPILTPVKLCIDRHYDSDSLYNAIYEGITGGFYATENLIGLYIQNTNMSCTVYGIK